MTTTAQYHPFLSEEIPSLVISTAGDRYRSPIALDDEEEQAAREAWEEMMNCLIEWGAGMSQFDDEGVEPPSHEVLQKAYLWAQKCRDHLVPPPDTVVPDPNGGIVFERHEGNRTEVLHFWDDGDIEYRCFEGTNLVRRVPLS